MPINIIPALLIGLLLLSCSPEDEKGLDITVERYYQTYNEHQELDKFIDFYDENIVFEDIINGDRIAGKEKLKIFFDWNNPDFKRLEDNILEVTEIIIKNNKVVVKGYFTRFKWRKTEYEAMHFTTLLTFNELGKIIKQVDWINYPTNLVDYNERKNSNAWIK